jgi:hypothetical protein
MPAGKKIQIRRGSRLNWSSVNPTLQSGELALETDTSKVKAGDGSSPWNSLGYIRFDGGSLDPETTSTSVSAGNNVSVQAVSASSSNTSVNLTFDSVSGAGSTSVTNLLNYSNSSPSLPANFSVGDSVAVFSIQSTATFSGSVTVCFFVPDYIDQTTFSAMRIFKLSNGATTDVTVLSGPNAPNFSTRKICASVTSFSEFYIIPSTAATTAAPTTAAPTTAAPTTTPAPTVLNRNPLWRSDIVTPIYNWID